jgi:hypothetical protein
MFLRGADPPREERETCMKPPNPTPPEQAFIKKNLRGVEST